ncbi:MAG: acyl-CoA thioesterase [Sciscionella sp.]
MHEVLRHRLRVRYAECDQQGVVFNGHYLFYADLALTELFRRTHGSYQALIDAGFDVVVAEATVRFLAAAHFDEELDLRVVVTHLGDTSMRLAITVWHGTTAVAEVDTRHVFVDPGTGDKKIMSSELRSLLDRFAVGEDTRSG